MGFCGTVLLVLQVHRTMGQDSHIGCKGTVGTHGIAWDSLVCPMKGSGMGQRHEGMVERSNIFPQPGMLCLSIQYTDPSFFLRVAFSPQFLVLSFHESFSCHSYLFFYTFPCVHTIVFVI